MSAITDQFNCERIEIAILALNAGLAALVAAGGIVHADKSTQTSETTVDRIVVAAETRAVASMGHNPATPYLYSVILNVTVFMATNDPAQLDAYVAAIQAANAPGPADASIITLATSLFGARGFEMHNVEEGDRQDSENERKASIKWKCVFGA